MCPGRPGPLGGTSIVKTALSIAAAVAAGVHALSSGVTQALAGDRGRTAIYVVANTSPPDAFLALRTRPAAAIGQRIMLMPNGTKLRVLQRNRDGWWYVRVVETGQEGWVLSREQDRFWVVAENAPYQDPQYERDAICRGVVTVNRTEHASDNAPDDGTRLIRADQINNSCLFYKDSDIGRQILVACRMGYLCEVRATVKSVDADVSYIVSVRSVGKSTVSQPLGSLTFQQLPSEIRNHALEVRKSCAELAGDNRTFNDMQGIEILDLKGDGSRAMVVDNEGLCGTHMAGANCSNRSCEMRVYKEISEGVWQKILDENLYGKYLAIDWERMRLQLMVVFIYAGDPRCQPEPGNEYTSGKTCNLIVTYRNNKWNWQLIR